MHLLSAKNGSSEHPDPEADLCGMGGARATRGGAPAPNKRRTQYKTYYATTFLLFIAESPRTSAPCGVGNVRSFFR